MAGQPKPAFYAAVAVVIAGLVAFAVWRADIFAPAGNDNADNGGEKIDPGKLGGMAGGGGVEAPDERAVTTVSEWTPKPSEKLPDVKGVSAYRKLDDNTVRFALNVWAGWAPIVYANEGFAPGKVWRTPDGEEFKVELVLIDDIVQMRDTYAAGEVHIGWATLDMMPLLMNGFVKAGDSRVMPRIYQQVDWSNGGDGIVVREDIKTVADLRGKKVALAENSPSDYFLLNVLVDGGLQPSEIERVNTGSAFEAAAAFNDNRDIAACVSWAPDVYNLAEAKGNRMLVTTQTANKLIADVWFARADFAKDHNGKVEGLVRGIFDAMEDLKQGDARKRCAEYMSKGYNIPAAEITEMFADAHSTNWAENYQFFLNQNNPRRFEKVWEEAYYLYGTRRKIDHTPVPFHQVMDFSIIKKLGAEEKYASQKDEYRISFVPKSTKAVQVEGEEVLANSVVIHFAPNSWNLDDKIVREEGGKKIEELHDPNVPLVLESVAKLVEKYGAARVIIEGHTDSSRKGIVDAGLVKELSGNRAKAVMEKLVQDFEIDQNRINTEGKGWDEPADAGDPLNQAKNRRVEIRVFSAEAG